MNSFDTIYRPEGEVKGAVAIVHGMSEHQKRYRDFAEYLKNRGYGAVTYDLPGHGEHAEELGWFKESGGADMLIDSAVDRLREAREAFPDVPLFLFGHSMGTMISRCLLQDHDQELNGLILSGAPCWQKAADGGIAAGKVIRFFKGKKGHSRFMDQAVTGSFNKCVKNPRTQSDWLSCNTANVDAYLADPLCGFPFTIQGYLDEMELMKRMHNVSGYHVTKPDLPIWFISGEGDPCRGGDEGFNDSISTLRRAGYQDVDAKLWPNMRHEILNETDRMQVFEAVGNWLDEHC